MMTEADWKSIQNFSPLEFTVPERMDYDFLRQLDAFRVKLDEPVVVNYSNGQEKHAAGSLHYEGKAVDIMLRRPVTLDDFLLATRFFSEVGLYPGWERAGEVRGGLHLGYERFAISFAMQRKYWLGRKNDDGRTEYLAMTQKNLRRCGFLS